MSVKKTLISMPLAAFVAIGIYLFLPDGWVVPGYLLGIGSAMGVYALVSSLDF